MNIHIPAYPRRGFAAGFFCEKKCRKLHLLTFNLP